MIIGSIPFVALSLPYSCAHKHCLHRGRRGIVPPMNNYQDLANVIRRTVSDARDQGLDYTGQTEHAVRAVMAIRNDMDGANAMHLVTRVRAER